MTTFSSVATESSSNQKFSFRALVLKLVTRDLVQMPGPLVSHADVFFKWDFFFFPFY